MRFQAIPVLVALLALPVAAQQSASYKLGEHVFNAGGDPAGFVVPASASYKITLDSIGEGVVRTGMSSASYRMDGSFAGCYPPPGEVRGLRFTDALTMAWDPEKSVGHYNLYRDAVASLPGLGYGTCLQQGIPDETVTDSDPVPLGDGYFYLVTVENRLHEEGTKGTDSGGATRHGTMCP
jgi:hypothetical protein